MRKLSFKDYKSLATDISNTYKSVITKDEYNDVSIIAKYNEAKNIIGELVKAGYELNNIAEFSAPDFSGYKGEYNIVLYENSIWCEPMRRSNDNIINDTSTITYVMGDCSFEILEYISNPMYEACVKADCGDDCADCTCNSSYKINNKPVTKEEYVSTLKNLEKKYDSLYDDFLKTFRYW